MPDVTSDDIERVCAALGWDSGNAVSVEPLATLPHSFVARVGRNGASMIFKQAGSPEFAAGMAKELIVNRDVLSPLPVRVGPELLASDEQAERPWMLFEDVSTNHVPAPTQPPPYPFI